MVKNQGVGGMTEDLVVDAQRQRFGLKKTQLNAD